MPDQDCYFYTTGYGDERHISMICTECHEKFPDLGWFYPGSEKGYGPYLFTCEKCQKVIFKPKKARKKKDAQDPT